MATFVLIHGGGGDVGWYWHLLESELRARGHDVVAPDLPCEDDSAGLPEYADTVVAAVGERTDLVVVAHSFGAFTGPLVAQRLPVDVLVLMAGMVPAPGEAPDDWWGNTGYAAASKEQAERDGGLTGHEDALISFYHDVAPALAEEALRRSRGQSGTASAAPWPLTAWPNVPTRFVLCTEDRLFPAEFLRGVVADRLGIVPDELAASHCGALSRPVELADLLESYLPVGRSPGGPAPSVAG